jgi:hypothetical protein
MTHLFQHGKIHGVKDSFVVIGEIGLVHRLLKNFTLQKKKKLK